MSRLVAANPNSNDHSAGVEGSNRYRLPNLLHKLNEQSGTTAELPAFHNNYRLITVISLFLALLAVTIKLLAGYAGSEISRAGHTTSTKIHRIIMNSDIVSLPANMIRYRSQRRATESQKLDIYLHWPTFTGYSNELKAAYNSVEINKQIIFVTLAPRFSEFDMSARIEPIYKNFFVGQQKQIGHNLTSQPLDPDNGFINEHLIVEKNNPIPFSARCANLGNLSGSAYCIRDINIGEGLSLTYRFHVDLIPQWFDLEQSIVKNFNAMVL